MKNAVYVIILNFLIIFSASAQNNRIDGLRPDAPELAKPGIYKIGVRTLNLKHNNQIDAVNLKEGEELSIYVRPITVEVWYPADTNRTSGEYKNVLLRDAKTKVSLYGKAVRDARPLIAENPYPLVVISHGYPGNRFLMSHFGENLASKGYVVVSIDHTDSMYQDAGAFVSTLLNRPLDQKFVLTEMKRMNTNTSHFLYKMVDTNNAGLMGYSMGGYGALISAGGGITKQAAENPDVSPNQILKRVMAGTYAHKDMMFTDTYKAIIAFAPWGMGSGFWDDQSLSDISIPIFFITGSEDQTSGYETGTKALFEKTENINRYLLTFANANHNAIAPIPAPDEAWTAKFNDGKSLAYTHYTDMVWDSVRANNIAQHFVTAYFGKMLKGNNSMDDYLGVTPNSNDGTGDTNWKGFKPRSAKGLQLEYLAKED
ncbi:MAG: dienelactone hydrolase [Kordiimonadaceae bacterium]|nr:dienelactone hydrolase [Kordiimonadaceae bacterium]